MLKLFYSPGACSMAAHIVLEEIGKPYEAEVVSIPKGQTQELEWKAVNPKGRVPALLGVPGRMGGKPDLLTEVNAITFYLARTNPGAKLLPADPAAEARASNG
jgi:glutathione S-transferase